MTRVLVHFAALVLLNHQYAFGSVYEDRLLQHLFKNYNKNVRPVQDENSTVRIRIKHTVKQIFNVDERKELLFTSGWCSLRWRDEYLTWDPHQYNGIKVININPFKIWIPDIVLYEDTKGGTIFGSPEVQKQSRLTVDHHGEVVWALSSIFVTKCHFDIYYFPFDMQSCPFRYGSWSYEKGRIDIDETSSMDVEHNLTHVGGWHVMEYSSALVRQDYTGGVYESVNFMLTFKRRALFRALNLLLPPSVIGILVLLSFVLPAATGERLTSTVTLLLAMTFFIINVTSLIPSDFETIPIIYRFFISTTIEIVLLIVAQIFGMQMYHKKSYDPPMPSWVRNIVLNKLAYWLGTVVRKKEATPTMVSSTPLTPVPGIRQITAEDIANDGCSYLETNKAESLVEEEDEFKHSPLEKGNEDDMVVEEWRLVALTIDKFLFYVFLLTWIIIHVIFIWNSTFKGERHE